MSEVKVKANPDYSKSAVNMTNPKEVADLLVQYQAEEAQLKTLNDEAEKCVPQRLKDQIEIATKWHTETNGKIRGAIDSLGSYQGDAGIAVKQCKVSITYLASKVLTVIPQFAQAIIEQTVNKGKVEGLLKGGLITADQADQISTKSESYAYIIK